MNGISVKEKTVISVLSIWSFINTFILIKNISAYWQSRYGLTSVYLDGNRLYPSRIFYPFTYNESPPLTNFDIRLYDYSEYFVYVGGVWLIYFLYRYLKGSK